MAIKPTKSQCNCFFECEGVLNSIVYGFYNGAVGKGFHDSLFRWLLAPRLGWLLSSFACCMLAGYSLALLPSHLIASNEEVSSVPGERKQMIQGLREITI